MQMRSGPGERALQRDQASAPGKGEQQVTRTGPGRQDQLAEQTEKPDLPTDVGLRPALLGHWKSLQGTWAGSATSRWLQFGFSQTRR